MRFIKLILLFVLVLFEQQALGAVDLPKPLTTFPPAYPPIARAAKAEGAVKVLVQVDSSGKVIAVSTIEGHPLLRSAAENAIKQWTFERPSFSPDNSSFEITIIFLLKHEEAVHVEDSLVFTKPHQLEFTYKIPTIASLTRIDGKIPDETCPLHQQKMVLGIVPIWYGLPMSEISHPNDLLHLFHNLRRKLAKRDDYWINATRKFPHSNAKVGGGCIVGVETKSEVLFCQQCRAIEENWCRKHRDRC